MAIYSLIESCLELNMIWELLSTDVKAVRRRVK